MVCGESQAFPQPCADASDSRNGLGKQPDCNLEEVLHAGPDFECGHCSRHPGAPCELHRIIEQNFIASRLDEQRRQARKVGLKWSHGCSGASR